MNTHIWLHHFQNNRGAFSPFMFGLLLGISAFSLSTAYIAQKKLLEEQQRQQQQSKTEADNIRNAFESLVLTETRETYNSTLSLDNAMRFATGTTGRSRSGEEVTTKNFNSIDATGKTNQRIVISASEDRLLTETLSNVGSAEGLLEEEKALLDQTAVFDENAARLEQVRRSYEMMDILAGHIYTYYAMHLKFPDATGFALIDSKTKLRDVWGTPFVYEKQSDTQATLSFTTPWGYKREIKLNL